MVEQNGFIRNLFLGDVLEDKNRNRNYINLDFETIEDTIKFAMLLYAVYSVHNQLRDMQNRRELKFQIGPAMHDCHLSKKDRVLWNKFIGIG